MAIGYSEAGIVHIEARVCFLTLHIFKQVPISSTNFFSSTKFPQNVALQKL